MCVNVWNNRGWGSNTNGFIERNLRRQFGDKRFVSRGPRGIVALSRQSRHSYRLGECVLRLVFSPDVRVEKSLDSGHIEENRWNESRYRNIATIVGKDYRETRKRRYSRAFAQIFVAIALAASANINVNRRDGTCYVVKEMLREQTWTRARTVRRNANSYLRQAFITFGEC